MAQAATPTASCLNSLMVLRYYLKSLKPSAMAKVRKHVARCKRCRAKLIALETAAEQNAKVRLRN
jgi:hypothetical protein